MKSRCKHSETSGGCKRHIWVCIYVPCRQGVCLRNAFNFFEAAVHGFDCLLQSLFSRITLQFYDKTWSLQVVSQHIARFDEQSENHANPSQVCHRTGCRQ